MRFRNFLIYIVDLLALVVLVLFTKNIENNCDMIITYNNTKKINSSYITYVEPQKEQQEVIKEAASLPKIVEETIKEPIVEEKKVEITPTIKDNIIETFVGNMTGYGPDCYGCTSNRTSSGYYVGEGNIYYQDSEYGNIRIVAGDKKYPFGTIVKLSNLSFSEPIIAIVLDRGSAIGIDKKIQFDLLFDSEKNIGIGTVNNVQFDILRLGY